MDRVAWFSRSRRFGAQLRSLALLCLLVPPLVSAVELNLGPVASPLEGMLVRDQVQMYLTGLELPVREAAPAYRCALEVRHRKGRLFDYTLELFAGDQKLGRQSGTYSFEEFREGFGRAFETMLLSPADLKVISLEDFRAPGDEADLRRRFIERLEATERVLVLESADFAHHRLRVQLRKTAKGFSTEMSVDGSKIASVAEDGREMWASALAVASRVLGQELQRVRILPEERGEGSSASRPLTRGPLDYRIGAEPRLRQSQFDGEGYPMLVEKGARLTILRPGSYPRVLRLNDQTARLQPVVLSPRPVNVAFRILAPGHRAGPLQLRGYDGEELTVEDGNTVRLKRDIKYRYSLDVWQRGSWKIVGGWFVLPESGSGPLELYDEQFPDNLELSLQEEAPGSTPPKSAADKEAADD